MTLTKNVEGSVFAIGKDFRSKIASQDDRQFGIPRRLKIAHPVSQIALGRDHVLFLTSESQLYSMGSNMYG